MGQLLFLLYYSFIDSKLEEHLTHAHKKRNKLAGDLSCNNYSNASTNQTVLYSCWKCEEWLKFPVTADRFHP